MDSNDGNFQTVDFVIFFALFIISFVVGGFFGYRDRNNQTTENYYFGGRKLSPIPVSISIAVTYISAITVIGTPSEIYMYGTVAIWHFVTLIFVQILAIVYCIPLFHKLEVKSVYEYLELRYHRSIRFLVSGIGIFTLIAYLSIASFVPALALNTVTPLKLEWTIALTAITCTAYTALGGMKAVMWTDVIQSFIMIGGSIALFSRTLYVLGDFELISEAVERGGRYTFFRSDFDPRIRSTAWAMAVGSFMTNSYQVLCGQMFVQRWLSCKTVNTSRLAVVLSAIPLALLVVFAFLNGLAAYKYYEGCDPLQTGVMTNADQIIPHLAINVFRTMPGMAGLFVSAAFCGTLSTVSSGINSLSSLVLTDFLSLLCPDFTSRNSVTLSKIMTIIFGSLTMGTAYLFSVLGSNAFGNLYSVIGLFSGPILTIFTLGIFSPWINYKSILVGSFFGLAIVSWIAFGALLTAIDKSFWSPLPLTTDNCTEYHDANAAVPQTLANVSMAPELNEDKIATLGKTIYVISPLLYGGIGFIASLVATHIAAIFTGFRTPAREDLNLSVSIVPYCCLPKAMRKYYDFDTIGKADYEKGNGVTDEKEILELSDQ